MRWRLTNLRLDLDRPNSDLALVIARVVGLTADAFSFRVLRKSLDTRDKSDVHFVYSVELTPRDTTRVVTSHVRGVKVEPYAEPPFALPDPGSAALRDRPIVVGSGPGGLMAGYFLAEAGYRPLILERGRIVTQRIRDVKEFDAGGRFEPESNYLFGEGGAGTFSDGKLTSRSSGSDVQRVLEVFAECKGKPEILYEHRPHLGSNRLPAVVKAIRQRIESRGGEVLFDTPVEDLFLRGNAVAGVETPRGRFLSNAVILAIGHSARDSFAMLHRRGVPLEQKPFQMGVRIEHPQDQVNRAQYGPAHLEDVLGNADYSLIAHGQRDLFTFCMCAGGYIIPSVSSEGYFCTNGMSLSKRDSFYANSGLMMTVPVEAFGADAPLAGIRLQEEYERRAFEIGGGEYRCPVQSAGDFLRGRRAATAPACSYPRQTVSASLDDLLPPIVAAAVREGLPLMDRRWRGQFLRGAVIAGPEARGSSPVRIVRDPESRESPLAGLYPVGEGAGYAGGIVSAAVDGLKTAKAVIARFARP